MNFIVRINKIKKIFVIISVLILLLSITGCDTLEYTGNEIIAGPVNINDEPVQNNGENPADEIPNANNNGDDNDNKNDTDGKYEDGFVFIYNGVNVYMGDYIENVLKDIGPQSDYYESESCTSPGMMQTYCYGGIEIATYAKTENDKFRIFSIGLIDDNNSTAEGIYIGQSVGDMIEVYGSEYAYADLLGSYKYTKNGTELTFEVDGDIITAITYTLLRV